ncbi:MAG TPA: pyridoxamine 5'-phosphate oxidase family protein [Dongiaceae bacterium]|nr:pyridoxamine 5'-phosphate oxidase family protein [Dongiaceae bacterium]
MFTEEIRRCIEGISLAMVATSDESGNPHLAVANRVLTLDDQHLMLENWYCPATLRNIARNPSVAIVVMSRDAEIGYQFIGNVAHGYDVALLSGYAPEVEPPGEPQALTRIVVRVDEVLAFCSGIHTDQPLKNCQQAKP